MLRITLNVFKIKVFTRISRIQDLHYEKKIPCFHKGACIWGIQNFSENHFEMYQEVKKYFPVFHGKFPKIVFKRIYCYNFSKFLS